ncbi:hypothetical protein CDAR_603451 [Caerostris darwini]|uniref:Uncharacterized protein n=1 Tax=Caerostris darwini TaxID=1538125 RepID=A0AAV4T365_9ARAC|nr:hypothetical protein CDAR_603451 [Caerostris darwini]
MLEFCVRANVQYRRASSSVRAPDGAERLEVNGVECAKQTRNRREDIFLAFGSKDSGLSCRTESYKNNYFGGRNSASFRVDTVDGQDKSERLNSEGPKFLILGDKQFRAFLIPYPYK